MTSIESLLDSIKLTKQKNKDGITYGESFEEAGIETVEDIQENITSKEELVEYINPKPIHLKKILKVLADDYNVTIESSNTSQPGQCEEKENEGQLSTFQKYPERKNWKGLVDVYKKEYKEVLVPQDELSKRELNQKTLLIIGETGVGKSTLINSMVNYLYGVKFTDNYKLRLINEAELLRLAKKNKTSVTTTVTEYVITPTIDLLNKHVIKILDTPGFGDTGGFERDEEIFEDITTHFKTKLSSITAICIVVKSSDTRSTITQQYIFSRLFSLFGKDVESNIYVLCTFASLNTPPCIEVLKSDSIKCPFQEYFKFDNSAFFIKKSKNKENLQVQSLYYDIGIKSFNNFYNYILNKNDVALKLTKDKFTKEEKLKFKIKSVRDNIDLGVDKVYSLEDLKQQIKTTKNQKSKIEGKRTYPMHKIRHVKKHMTTGSYTTICNSCKWTCHDDCGVPPNEKQNCWAIGSNGYCTKCPSSCHHGSHTNEPYVWVAEKYTEMVTNEDILRDYNKYNTKLSLKENMLNSVQSQLDDARARIVQDFKDIERLNKELKQISLRYKPVTQKKYLTMLIEKERKELKDGWKTRVDTYEGVIDKIQLQSGQLKGSSNLDKVFQHQNPKKKNKKWGLFGW